jgi:hypothetical protein
MTLGTRKLIVLVAVAAIFAMANIWLVVNWLNERGLIDLAQYVRREYLTGTAITVVTVLLILLVRPGGERGAMLRRCSVCDRVLIGHGRYCADCGSKVV